MSRVHWFAKRNGVEEQHSWLIDHLQELYEERDAITREIVETHRQIAELRPQLYEPEPVKVKRFDLVTALLVAVLLVVMFRS